MSDPGNGSPAQDWLTLDDGETVEWTGQPHVYSLVPALVIGVLLAIVLIGLVIIGWAFLVRKNTVYVITNEALYVKRGVVSRDVQRIGYEKVQNTSYSQDFFGKRFGYGHVEVSTAGGSGVEMRFRSVPEPKAVQERVNRHIRGSGADRTDREDAAAVLDEILDELRAIRTAIEADDWDEDGVPDPITPDDPIDPADDEP